MMKTGMLVISIIVAVGSGCCTVTPPFAVPEEEVPQAWECPVPASSLPISAGLLDVLDDNALREVVEEGLRRNHNLKATALRLQATGLLLSVPRSQLLPSLTADFSKGRNNQGVDITTGDARTDDTHRMGVNVRWELDLWGRLADEYASATHGYHSQEQQLRLAADALAARLIRGWIAISAAGSAVAIEAERVDMLERIEEVLMDRYRQGLGTLDELSTAKSRTSLAQADFVGRKEARDRAARHFHVLMGGGASDEYMVAAALPEIGQPPIGVPAAVLKKRPDVAAAWQNYLAARRSASAASKARLPDLSISGSVFKEHAELSGLGGATALWSILGSITQPLFEGGRLQDTSRARDLEAEAVLEDFGQTILTAVEEAENTLGRERELALQELALAAAVQESISSSRYYEKRYLNGLDTIQNLLAAREQEMAAKLRLNDIRSSRLENRVDMALAMGMTLKKQGSLEK